MSSPLSALSEIAEQRIREAQEAGEFDNLPGAGKALCIEDDSMVPEELRMAYKILRNAGYIPRELAERNEITSLVELLEGCDDEAHCLRQMHKLQCLLRGISTRRQRPIVLEESDPYFSNILQRVRVVQQRMAQRRSDSE